ncbi:MAG: outer membrane beta-barrel protein [Bacteroidales bacterium]|nr:outer membrane beta-barrel protein [Bacteroidales bacterium]MDT8373219.1 outer membrane beta-barrel protein [Bacteroidales bacterium]
MFNREPNIDVVFRNGLKDLEVLPPSDVWENIPPMPFRRSAFRTVTSIAAGIAALVSLALVAGWYLRSNDPGLQLAEMAITSGEQQAVRVNSSAQDVVETATDRTVPPGVAVTVPAELTEGMIAGPAAVTDDHLAALSGLTYAGRSPEESLQFSSDEITVITAGRLTGAGSTAVPALPAVSSETAGHRFMVGASLSPSMGFSPQGQNSRLAELMSSESSRPSYTTGLTVGYRISDRLTIHSGIGLASVGQTINEVDVFAGLSDFYSVKSNYLYSVETASGMIRAGNTDLYLTDAGNRVGSLVQGADPSKYNLTQVGSEIRQVFRYLELPLLVRYKVIDGRMGLNLSGGVAYGLLVDNAAYTGQGSDIIRVGHTEGVNPYNISSQLGLGMEYNISTNVSFNFEPVLRYYMTPLSDISGALYKPYSLGIYSGLFFKF